MRAHINLVNPALLPPKPFFQFRSFVITLMLVLLVLSLISLFVQRSTDDFVAVAEQGHVRRMAREAHVKALEASAQPRRASEHLVVELAQTREMLSRLQSIETSLQQPAEGATSPADSLRALSASVSEGVWLSSAELSDGRLSLQGYALDPARVPVYLAKLQAQPAFAGQRFDAFELGRQRLGNTESAPEALMFKLQSSARRAAP